MLRRLVTLVLVLAASGAAAQPSGQGPAQARIEAVSRQLADLAADQSRGGDVLDEGKIRLAALNASEGQLMARMGANQNTLSRLLGALQMYGKHPPPALFIHPGDATKAVRAAILIRAVMPALQSKAQAFSAQVDQAMRVRRQAASASEVLFTAESDMADRASHIEDLIAEKQTLRQQLGGEAATSQPDIPALAARIQTLRADPAAVAASVRPDPAPAGKWMLPVASPPSGKFGQAAPAGGLLQGWTWTPVAGAPIAAPAASRVEYAGPLRGWDNVLILDVGGGYRLVLAGAHTLTTSAGASLVAGQTVAKMASAAGAKSPAPQSQLYLEVRKGGDPVDPARFFAAIGQ